MVPPFEPAHDQVKLDALVDTDDAPPALQRLELGAVANEPPCEEPHAPLPGHVGLGREQYAVVPPLLPVHCHVLLPLHEPAFTAVTLPTIQVLAVVEQLPFSRLVAEQLAVLPTGVPPPVHDHVNVEPELTDVAVPDEHKLLSGAP